MRDLIDTLAVWQVWGIDKSSNTASCLGFAQVEPEGRGVSKYVATDWLCWVAPHCIWLGVNLVGNEYQCIVHIGKLLQIFQVTVEFLLAVCQHSSADEFCSEVAGERIDNDHLDIEAFAHSLDFVNQKHLVS